MSNNKIYVWNSLQYLIFSSVLTRMAKKLSKKWYSTVLYCIILWFKSVLIFLFYSTNFSISFLLRLILHSVLISSIHSILLFSNSIIICFLLIYSTPYIYYTILHINSILFQWHHCNMRLMYIYQNNAKPPFVYIRKTLSVKHYQSKSTVITKCIGLIDFAFSKDNLSVVSQWFYRLVNDKMSDWLQSVLHIMS